MSTLIQKLLAITGAFILASVLVYSGARGLASGKLYIVIPDRLGSRIRYTVERKKTPGSFWFHIVVEAVVVIVSFGFCIIELRDLVLLWR